MPAQEGKEQRWQEPRGEERDGSEMQDTVKLPAESLIPGPSRGGPGDSGRSGGSIVKRGSRRRRRRWRWNGLCPLRRTARPAGIYLVSLFMRFNIVIWHRQRVSTLPSPCLHPSPAHSALSPSLDRAILQARRGRGSERRLRGLTPGLSLSATNVRRRIRISGKFATLKGHIQGMAGRELVGEPCVCSCSSLPVMQCRVTVKLNSGSALDAVNKKIIPVKR